MDVDAIDEREKFRLNFTRYANRGTAPLTNLTNVL